MVAAPVPDACGHSSQPAARAGWAKRIGEGYNHVEVGEIIVGRESRDAITASFSGNQIRKKNDKSAMAYRRYKLHMAKYNRSRT